MARLVVPTAWALLPLRLFLGLTFVDAGVGKLLSSAYFGSGSEGFASLARGFARGSPIGGMVRSVVLAHPYLFALLLAVVELTVGVLALIGLASRVAAAGGLALSLLFFLTASWHVRPFFYGAALPFAVGWLTLLLANPSDLPGLDRRLLQRAQAEAEAKSDTAPDASRRAFLAGLAQAGRIALGVLVTSASVVPLVGASPGRGPRGTTTERIGSLAQLPVGHALSRPLARVIR